MKPSMQARDVFRALRWDGWTVTPTQANHLRCVSPAGVVVFTSGRFEGRGADRWALPNFLRDLKRIAGWTPPA